jgi:hypothetical protein
MRLVLLALLVCMVASTPVLILRKKVGLFERLLPVAAVASRHSRGPDAEVACV